MAKIKAKWRRKPLPPELNEIERTVLLTVYRRSDRFDVSLERLGFTPSLARGEWQRRAFVEDVEQLRREVEAISKGLYVTVRCGE